MRKNLIEERVARIASKYIASELIDTGTPLTAKPYYLNARNLAALFIDVEKEFKIDLNEIIDEHMDFSLGAICRAIEKLEQAEPGTNE